MGIGLSNVLRAVLLSLVAVVLLFEEWGWQPLTAFAAHIARWPPFARLCGVGLSPRRRVPPKATLPLNRGTGQRQTNYFEVLHDPSSGGR